MNQCLTNRALGLGGVCLGSLLVSQSFAQAEFRGLGDLPGGAAFSRPWAISSDGTTVVGISRSSNGDEAFRWKATTGIVGLGDFAGGGFSSLATDVSADGSVVVGQGRTTAGDAYFVWKADTGLTPILDGFFPVLGSAIAVSDDGQKVACIRRDTSQPQLVIWTRASGLQPSLGVPSYAFEIVMSGDGHVIVCGNERWTDGIGPVTISTDYPNAIATTTTRDGTTTCGTSGSGGFPSPFACRSSSLADAQPLWRTTSSRGIAKAVSDDASVIVGTDGENAMYWSGPTGAVKLKDWVVAKFGLQLTGWRLRSAVGISADGKVIAGEGTNPSGAEEAWLLRLPSDEACPSDFNADGGVDFSDVEAFFERWENGC
jgi:probable HAF family extracellular repeat protein